MIEVKGVTKSFDDFTALDNLTCNIAEGCIYGMVGSNGAGKSTLLRVLSGIYKADKGEAIIDSDRTMYAFWIVFGLVDSSIDSDRTDGILSPSFIIPLSTWSSTCLISCS